MNKIAIASDHAGYELKEKIKSALDILHLEYVDFGTNSTESVDYPDYIHALAWAIESKQLEKGIIVCGSGNGVAMTANKYPNVRAALCWMPSIAALVRQHNDANVLSIPARFMSEELAMETVMQFLSTPFEGGRHEIRVNKINQCLC